MPTFALPVAEWVWSCPVPRVFPPASRQDRLFEALRSLIAASETFQIATDSADASAATARVHKSVVAIGSTAPLCLVPDLKALQFARVGTGVSMPSGSVTVQFIDLIDGIGVDSGGELIGWPGMASRMRRWVGGVVDDLMALREQPGYVGFRSAELDDEPWVEMRKRRALHLKKVADGHYGQNVTIHFDWTAVG